MKKLIIVLLLACNIIFATNSFFQEEENIGKSVFDKTCTSCHTGGFKGWITGAPEIGDWDDWELYFQKGFSVLVTNVIEGKKGHAVKGECEDCTGEQIKAAIEYIISETNNDTEK